MSSVPVGGRRRRPHRVVDERPAGAPRRLRPGVRRAVGVRVGVGQDRRARDGRAGVRGHDQHRAEVRVPGHAADAGARVEGAAGPADHALVVDAAVEVDRAVAAVLHGVARRGREAAVDEDRPVDDHLLRGRVPREPADTAFETLRAVQSKLGSWRRADGPLAAVPGGVVVEGLAPGRARGARPVRGVVDRLGVDARHRDRGARRVRLRVLARGGAARRGRARPGRDPLDRVRGRADGHAASQGQLPADLQRHGGRVVRLVDLRLGAAGVPAEREAGGDVDRHVDADPALKAGAGGGRVAREEAVVGPRRQRARPILAFADADHGVPPAGFGTAPVPMRSHRSVAVS